MQSDASLSPSLIVVVFCKDYSDLDQATCLKRRRNLPYWQANAGETASILRQARLRFVSNSLMLALLKRCYVAAIKRNSAAVYKSAGPGGKKDNEPFNIFRLARPAERNIGPNALLYGIRRCIREP